MSLSSHQSLSQVDLSFARSRRRADGRRERISRRRAALTASGRASLAVSGLLSLGVLGFFAVPAVSGLVADSYAAVASRAPTAVDGLSGIGATVPASWSSEGEAGADSCEIPSQFRQAFADAARETRVPLGLLVAVAHVESSMDPRALSHAGAYGLLQVMPAAAAEVELDRSVPEANVLAGARYLRRMLDRFGSLDAALAAYNAGPTAVKRSGGKAPSLETLTYVANVKRRFAGLGACR